VEERATLHDRVGIAVTVDAIGNFTRTREVGKGSRSAAERRLATPIAWQSP
jgi:hypothetical protein